MEDAYALFGAIGSLVISVGLLIMAVLAFLVPIFIYQIRNQVKTANKNMAVIINLLSFQTSTQGQHVSPAPRKTLSVSESQYKCSNCGTINRLEDIKCKKCGKSHL